MPSHSPFFDEQALWHTIDDTMLYWEFENYFKNNVKANPIPYNGQILHIILSSQIRPFEDVQNEFLALYKELIND